MHVKPFNIEIFAGTIFCEIWWRLLLEIFTCHDSW